MVPSLSAPEPFSVTETLLCPGCMVMTWFGPASAVGGVLAVPCMTVPYTETE